VLDPELRSAKLVGQRVTLQTTKLVISVEAHAIESRYFTPGGYPSVTHFERKYVLISPCRNEAAFMRRTLESVVAQSLPPSLWVIVDDGSTDQTPAILADYAARYNWIRLVNKPDRGHRAVGPGVIEAFYAGLASVQLGDFPVSLQARSRCGPSATVF
jgi:cellulose synthase/poly-beta-1,6-N-acetylglucosamine synthase-like glycosyltransferase